jgi:hypothetical protein
MKISDYHGKISQCFCTNSDPDKPMSCPRCFCRGFVAECLACQGTGQIEEPVAGAMKGTMKSTCGICGGKKVFAVNKPDGWDEAHPAVEVAEEVPQEAQTVA